MESLYRRSVRDATTVSRFVAARANTVRVRDLPTGAARCQSHGDSHEGSPPFDFFHSAKSFLPRFSPSPAVKVPCGAAAAQRSVAAIGRSVAAISRGETAAELTISEDAVDAARTV
eukprot:2427467-Pleurochrysis_carterae.AAC.2